MLSACSSGTVAVGYAADAIGWGQLDVALAGASDVLCRLTFSGFNALRLVDTEPCRPFCRTRASRPEEFHDPRRLWWRVHGP